MMAFERQESKASTTSDGARDARRAKRLSSSRRSGKLDEAQGCAVEKSKVWQPRRVKGRPVAVRAVAEQSQSPVPVPLLARKAPQVKNKYGPGKYWPKDSGRAARDCRPARHQKGKVGQRMETRCGKARRRQGAQRNRSLWAHSLSA